MRVSLACFVAVAALFLLAAAPSAHVEFAAARSQQPTAQIGAAETLPTTLVLTAYRAAEANTYVAAVEASTYTTTVLLGAQPNGYSGEAAPLKRGAQQAIAHHTFDE